MIGPELLLSCCLEHDFVRFSRYPRRLSLTKSRLVYEIITKTVRSDERVYMLRLPHTHSVLATKIPRLKWMDNDTEACLWPILVITY